MKKPKRILAVIEAQKDVQPALERAVELAKATDASLRLCLCDYVTGLSSSVLVSDEQVEKTREEYTSRQEAYLDGLAADAGDAGIENVDTEFRWQRPVFEGIIEAAEEFGADLVVKSAADRSIIDRMLLSATDWELIRKAPQPLWLVKQEDKVTDCTWVAAVDPAHPDEKHLGLDRRLVEAGLMLGRELGAQLRLFHAVTPQSLVAPTGGSGAAMSAFPVLPVDDDEVLEVRSEAVRKLADEFDIPDEQIDVHVGATVHELDNLVQEKDVALVIAGAVSRGMLERILIGNTAESMLNSITCDILVVKPDGFPTHEEQEPSSD